MFDAVHEFVRSNLHGNGAGAVGGASQFNFQ